MGLALRFKNKDHVHSLEVLLDPGFLVESQLFAVGMQCFLSASADSPAISVAQKT